MITPSNRLASATPLEVTSSVTIAGDDNQVVTSAVIAAISDRCGSTITSSPHEPAVEVQLCNGSAELVRMHSVSIHSRQHVRRQTINVLRARLAGAFFWRDTLTFAEMSQP